MGLLSFATIALCDPSFNNPPGVDVWCGKAYRDTNSSFDPGGRVDPPVLNSGPNPLRLRLNVYPRYNFYLETEKNASFLVDTRVSDQDPYGKPYVNSTSGKDNETEPFNELVLKVWIGHTIAVDNVRIPINSTGIEIPFDLDLAKLTGEAGPGAFEISGSSPDGLQTYDDLARVIVLPERSDGGSMARLDHLNGGVHVSSSLTKGAWRSILPMGFYTRWDWISWLVDPDNNPEPQNLASNETKSLQQYKERGYNLIHPVPPGGWASFDTAIFEKFLTICDELELYVMYDMRHTYLNLSSISYQLPRLQSHPCLLLYYTGDEPDGWTDPLNGTVLAYDQIKEIDPYHPVSLVLNCYNFYFKEYTSGADIILEDTYNLIKSSTFSTVYNTPCNLTYGDCGCDFCHINDTAYPEFVENPFQDVVERTNRMYQYQRWIGQKETKPVWGVPQWFYDEDSFWSRWATRQEAIVLALLRINHGAMGIVGWIFPTSPEVESATTDLAKVLAREDVTRLLMDGTGKRVQPFNNEENHEDSSYDIAAWVSGDEALVIAVWPKYTIPDEAVIMLPTGGRNVTGVEELFGDADWSWNGNSVATNGTIPLQVSMLKASLGGHGVNMHRRY
ncbi:uncharacterized protein N0V89_007556 [Didymosphaeria variabile]|uniref:Uncharacterized protein n=1 Tax=Didymosphaeria variabile TaxID=1932322 RepID=A0A9W9C9L1_9PLEO|nr:uncharacterized protein N0V89_007556 [Didymosphaeria variabile]KAJ4352209.1 hypothetical protein N0V89_007556 [Didymosphaeria variabile]